MREKQHRDLPHCSIKWLCSKRLLDALLRLKYMRCKGTFNDVLLLREDENMSRMQHNLIHFLFCTRPVIRSTVPPYCMPTLTSLDSGYHRRICRSLCSARLRLARPASPRRSDESGRFCPRRMSGFAMHPSKIHHRDNGQSRSWACRTGFPFRDTYCAD